MSKQLFFSMGILSILFFWSVTDSLAQQGGEIPMSHQLQSSEWETLDSLTYFGFTPAYRHIWVSMPGFAIRKTGIFGTEGLSPICINPLPLE
jgi:hypothetical protein